MNIGIPPVPISLLLIGGALDGRRVMVRIGHNSVQLPHKTVDGEVIQLTYAVEAVQVDGATFYLGLAQGTTMTDAFVRLSARYSELPASADEINPGNAVTQGLRGQWHKLLGIAMWKAGQLEIRIGEADIVSLARGYDGAMPCVVAQEEDNTLILRLMTAEEGIRLVREHDAKGGK